MNKIYSRVETQPGDEGVVMNFSISVAEIISYAKVWFTRFVP